MAYEKSITFLDQGAVMAECGPMRLIISASVGKVPQREMAIQAAKESFNFLERVARLRDVLGRRVSDIKGDLRDSLARRMFQSVLAIGDDDLTPMASVAGSIGDAVADFLFSRGMTKIIVDNGGDVAVRLREGESVRVGIRPDVKKSELSHIILLDSQHASWGVATSGLGGRSLTRGIASAVTAVAKTASLADAAATAIANSCFVEDEKVIQRMAEEIDPNTDILGSFVTVKVGPISDEKKALALQRAMQRAEQLSKKGLILGAYVAVGRHFAITDFVKERIVVNL